MLRSGYTTGACAAAASKAAVQYLLTGFAPDKVVLPFPDGQRIAFSVHAFSVFKDRSSTALASIIKDAGDDPDVTNGIEIQAAASYLPCDGIRCAANLVVCGGEGVGTVTKAGLAIPIGEPAINPVPRKMIADAVSEVLLDFPPERTIYITINVPSGKSVAKKTLNERLGIIGGISILGTTGIVKPISSKAWTDTIVTSMKVAEANDIKEIVISTGRTSESGFLLAKHVPEEALIMMGDYLQFTLELSKQFNFKRIYYSGMWAKILKGAMGFENTHVRHGALSINDAVEFLLTAGLDTTHQTCLKQCNSAREIFEKLKELKVEYIVDEVCRKASLRFSSISEVPVEVILITPNKSIGAWVKQNR